MGESTRCGYADELESAAAEQTRKGRQSPGNETAYFKSAAALRQAARNHAQNCKRCNADRLLEDEAAILSACNSCHLNFIYLLRKWHTRPP